MKKTEASNNEEDRISALPDSMIHHIFSFLNMTDVAQTRILSNRWRYLWISTPILNFEFPEKEDEDCLCDFVDNVLALGRSTSINELHITSHTPLQPSRVLNWVNAALERHVPHLYLCLHPNESFELPHHLFTSNIDTLVLMRMEPSSDVQLPSSICTAATLKHLSLHSLIFPNGNAKGELILSCPVLKTLRISRCSIEHLKVLHISTPLLENLNFKSLYAEKNKCCRVKTSTPNLKSFSLNIGEYDGTVDYALENFSSLVSASILENFYSLSTAIYSGNGNYLDKQWSDCLMKLLPSFSSVQILELYPNSIKVITGSSKLMEWFAHVFLNLKHVIVGDAFNSGSGHALLKFLKQLSQVETLVWKRCEGSETLASWQANLLFEPIQFEIPFLLYKEEKWEANLAFQSTLNCLKTLEIQNVRGTAFELSFLEWIFERAIVLKKINLKPCWPLSSNEKLSEFREKVLSLPSLASSSASISFQIEESQIDLGG